MATRRETKPGDDKIIKVIDDKLDQIASKQTIAHNRIVS